MQRADKPLSCVYPPGYGSMAIHSSRTAVSLSRGSDQVLQTCAERIVNVIIGKAAVRFRDGKPPRMIQIFIEEAHRLLDRDKFNKVTEQNDPYVKLARESAKYKIGLIYATQEVSAVDGSILSNTANWVCAYMNNASEVALVAKYYDFEQLAAQIITADDPGFIRLRTASSPYTLPVQIRKFDLAMINSFRAELGQPPVQASTDFAPGEAGSDDLSDVEDPDIQYSASHAPTLDFDGWPDAEVDH
jgi:DNA helicase HerA-like ATPase